MRGRCRLLALAGRIRAAGYAPDHIGHQWTGPGKIMLTLTARTEESFRVIPEGHVFTEICMRETTT
jgi:hypothetical protein